MENLVMSDTASSTLSNMKDVLPSSPIVFIVLIGLLVLGGLYIWKDDIEETTSEEA